MEEEDGGAYTRGSAMGNDALALSYSQKAGGVDAGSVDLVGRLKVLSSGRKKLMTKYFDLEEVESGPLLSEYFAVSLAFVALGAMIREANVRMRRKEKDSADGVSPKLQRMALDSMLKSAMERLRGLAHRTQTLEEKVRDRSYMEAAFQFERLEFLKRISALEAVISKHNVAVSRSVEAETAWRKEKEDLVKRIADVDAQRGYFFKKMAEAEGALADLQRLRMEDGKANAKLVEIYAGREQSWKSERLKMRHEIELLKEKLSKLQVPQSHMMKSPHSLDAAAEALRIRNLKRRAKEMVRGKVVSEREFASLVAVEPSPKTEPDLWSLKEFSLPAHDGNAGSPRESPVVSVDDRMDFEGADIHELSAAQNQEMEAELAIILKRVGALKRRGASGGKLDELLNEAKGKPKLKRLGSFDQAPRDMVVDDTILCRSEGNSLKDVEIDKEDAKDIWQAIEVQEGNNSVSRRNGLVDDLVSTTEPVKRIGFVDSPELIRERPPDSNSSQRSPDHDIALRMRVLDSTDFSPENLKPNPPEKSSNPRTPHWLTVVDSESIPVKSKFASQPIVVTEDEPRDSDDGGNWDDVIQVKPNAAAENDNDTVRESWEELIQESPTTPENIISERDGWEEFIQEKLDILENNISERTPEGDSTAPESVVAVHNSKLSSSDQTVEPLELHEDGRVESKKQDVKVYSVTCAELVILPNDEVPVVNDDGLDEDDIKSEILVGSDKVEEAHGELPLGSGMQAAEAESTQQIDDLLSAESGNHGELPGPSPGHELVEHSVVSSLELPEDDIKSEILVSNPIPISTTSDNENISTSTTSDRDHISTSTTASDSGHISTSSSESDHVSLSTASDGDRNSTSTTTLDSSDNIGTGGQLNRVNSLERQIDDVSDNGQSSTAPGDGQNLQLIAQDDFNNSTQQLSPGRTIMAGLELEQHED